MVEAAGHGFPLKNNYFKPCTDGSWKADWRRCGKPCQILSYSSVDGYLAGFFLGGPILPTNFPDLKLAFDSSFCGRGEIIPEWWRDTKILMNYTQDAGEPQDLLLNSWGH